MVKVNDGLPFNRKELRKPISCFLTILERSKKHFIVEKLVAFHAYDRDDTDLFIYHKSFIAMYTSDLGIHVQKEGWKTYHWENVIEYLKKENIC